MMICKVKTKGFKSMKYFLIFFIVVFFFPSAFARVCEESFSADGIDKGDFLRRADEELKQALKEIRENPEEPVLKAQGYKPTYYKGLDQAREFNAVAKYLKTIKAEPAETHIPYFSDQVEKTLADFEKGFRKHSQGNPELLEEGLKQLEVLKIEARKRVADQNVTYDWWATFNLRLPIMTSEHGFIYSMLRQKFGISIFDSEKDIKRKKELYAIGTVNTHEKAQEFFSNSNLDKIGNFLSSTKRNAIRSFNRIRNSFPEEIMFFTTDELGIMAFNRLKDNSRFIGVSGISLPADGTIQSPFEFFTHDLAHIAVDLDVVAAITPQNVSKRISNTFSSQFDREKAELALFMYRHEVGHQFFPIELQKYYTTGETAHFFRPLSPKEIKRSTKTAARDMTTNSFDRFFDSDDLQGLLPESVNIDQAGSVMGYLHESAEVFADILLAH